MKQFVKKQKFFLVSIVLLIGMTIIDIQLTYQAFENTWNQVWNMLLIVPPIFVLIGLFDVWVPRETIIKHMGETSKAKGMFWAFFLGAFSAGPTLIAFPIAMLMLKKGAKYSNVLFFLMVWSSLKLPIVFYQVTTLGLQFSLIINITMLIVFIISALLADVFFTKQEKDLFLENANSQQ
ncbi:permease [Candidatus Xianfuyuplasma coldseepsis]|uniref:Permease n=1 Tax=Candidatus Xianfuyuplasma coldseepsis TaxID=2782163 RepID=A0A7L7KR34_9MOLU|nr:permease [Xianfuyuplasma coldseepsis]QMS85281.1 permease [Xianfuyuplasma coldseepsis]